MKTGLIASKFPGMDDARELDELMTCRLDARRKAPEPCTLVIFGASGDLTSRKLVPALYHLFVTQQMPHPFRIVGVARRAKSDEAWRAELRSALVQFSRSRTVNDEVWQAFAASLTYCQGDFSEAAAYQRLAARITESPTEALRRNLLFYFATPPSQVPDVVTQLSQGGLLRKDENGELRQRIVVEKPFGHDLASAQQLNAVLTRHVHEKQVFRIDHYLGKETVQNILLFRFSNAIFEPLWARQSVDHVQVTVSEKLGVGNRGGHYEETGALRDMVQNHLLQVLALVTMEPPVSLDPEAIRDEKVKLLKSIRVWEPAQALANVIRGQYAAGVVDGQPRPAYRHEPKVHPDSMVETFVAMRLFIDNWRWSNVPFYLRTGKYLPQSASEVRVQFRPTPNVLFAAQCGPKLDANAITLRLQPDEGISLRFNGKVPGNAVQIRPVRMHFSYGVEFGAYTAEAYERLLLEAIAGDATLFIRRDEVEAAWAIIDPVRQAWEGIPLAEKDFYPAGTWGPSTADELLAQRGHAWRNPQPAT